MLITHLCWGKFRQGDVLQSQFFFHLSCKILIIGTNVSLPLTLLHFFQIVDELLLALDARLFTIMLKLGVICDLLLILEVDLQPCLDLILFPLLIRLFLVFLHLIRSIDLFHLLGRQILLLPIHHLHGLVRCILTLIVRMDRLKANSEVFTLRTLGNVQITH